MFSARTAFIAGAAVVLWSLFDPPLSKTWQRAGIVVEYTSGESIALGADEVFSDMAFIIRPHTRFNVDPATIRPGDHVAVFYRSVAERRPVADRVQRVVFTRKNP